jgi:hypothetical protein
VSRRLRAHFRSNVIGYVALFVALSGTAYAVDGSLPGKNTVGSADIINGEVKTPDIGSGQVGAGQVADDSTGRALTGNNIAANSLDAGDIADSTVEPDAYGSFHDAAVNVPFASGIGGNPRAGDEDVLSLALPAGNYFIVAKGNLNLVGGHAVTCLLYADGDRDRLEAPAASGPFTMAVLGGATGDFTVHLSCTTNESNPQCLTCTQVKDLKINAVAVRTLYNTAG